MTVTGVRAGEVTAVVWFRRDLRRHDHPPSLPLWVTAGALPVCAGRRIQFAACPGLLAVEPEDVISRAGGPPTVFTPFFRLWSEAPPRAVLPRPDRIPPPPGFERSATWRWDPETPQAQLLPGGEPAARLRLEAWLGEGLLRYAEDKDWLDLDGWP